jgi:hypothetical protein
MSPDAERGAGRSWIDYPEQSPTPARLPPGARLFSPWGDWAARRRLGRRRGGPVDVGAIRGQRRRRNAAVGQHRPPHRDRNFDGPGADVVNNICLACHSAGMILTQPRLPRSVWRAEVEKMPNTYKAPIASEDIPTIVDHLASLPR